MNTLISHDDNLALLAVVLCCVAFGCWLETKRSVGQFGLISVYLLATLLSALHVIPRSSELYTVINAYFVPLSLSLLLFKANIIRIWARSGLVLVAFLIAATGTVFGAALGIQLLDLGNAEDEISGIVVAAFVGGNVNFAAVADSFGLVNSEIASIIVASLFVVGVPYLAFLSALPGMGPVWRLFARQQPESERGGREPEPANATAEITATSLILALAVGSVIVWLSTVAEEIIGYTPLKYLLITLLSVLLATFFPKQADRLSGHYELGKIFIYSYFAIFGASVNFAAAFEHGSDIVMFGSVVIACHLLLLVIIGRLFKLSGPDLAIGSSACIVGPATAAAIATAHGWDDLITPGILAGIFGYVIATPLGIGFAAFF